MEPEREQKNRIARFVIRAVLVFIAVFLFANLLLWNKAVSPAFLPGAGHGDLSAKACIKLPEGETLPLSYNGHVMEMYEYMKLTNGGGDGRVDIVTIGSGFSRGGGGSFYQDYLQEAYGYRVLNITTEYDASPLEILNKLEGSYFMWVMMPRAVILECSEEELAAFAGDLTVYDEYCKEEIEQKVPIHIATDSFWNEQKAIEFWPQDMLSLNGAYIKSLLGQKKSAALMGGGVAKATLNRPLFSVKGAEDVLYYEKKPAVSVTEEDLHSVNDNLNAAVAHYVPLYDLKLILLPSVDKYEVYRPYIKDGASDRQKGETVDAFERLRGLPHTYTLIDTERILQEELAKGNMDVYWPDSAYWSPEGYRPVMDEIASVIED